jgi:hypothetical protein
MYSFSILARVLETVGCETPNMPANSLSLFLEFLSISLTNLRSFCRFMAVILVQSFKSLMHLKSLFDKVDK